MPALRQRCVCVAATIVLLAGARPIQLLAGADKTVVTDKGNAIVVDVEADGSQAAAKAVAIDALLNEVVKRLFDDRRVVITTSKSDLRRYVERFATAKTSDLSGKSQPTAKALVELNKIFASPERVRSLAGPSRPAGREALGYLLIPDRADTMGRAPTANAQSAVQTRRIQVRGKSADDANFYFTIEVRDNGRGFADVRVVSIEVDDDGSPGATRWEFSITVNQRVITVLPAASYDDDVPLYRLSPRDPGATFTVPVPKGVTEVRITGQRK